MRTMQVQRLARRGVLESATVPVPQPGSGEVLIRVSACGVCRTDLHVVDHDLPDVPEGIVPGHEIVGRIEAVGDGVEELSPGDRVGVPWLGWTCGVCRYCAEGMENLCDRPRFTGYTIHGGYGEFCVADARYVFVLPERYSDLEAAPLLCAGLIGYRSWAMVREAKTLGLYGFGAAAHIIAQVAAAEGAEIHAFTRAGDAAAQQLARDLGAVWTGGSEDAPPEPLDAAIIFAPVGSLVPAALRAVRKGGAVICAGIHMSEIPAFPYSILWEERTIRSVANLTRKDGEDFMVLADRVPIRTSVTAYPMSDANRALADLRDGRLTGAAVLTTAAGSPG